MATRAQVIIKTEDLMSPTHVTVYFQCDGAFKGVGKWVRNWSVAWKGMNGARHVSLFASEFAARSITDNHRGNAVIVPESSLCVEYTYIIYDIRLPHAVGLMVMGTQGKVLWHGLVKDFNPEEQL